MQSDTRRNRKSEQTYNKQKFAIKFFFHKENPLGPFVYTGDFYELFKEEIIPIPTNSYKIENRTLPNSFYQASISLIPKPS